MKLTGLEAKMLRRMIHSDTPITTFSFTDLVLLENPNIRLKEYEKLISDSYDNIEHFMETTFPDLLA